MDEIEHYAHGDSSREGENKEPSNRGQCDQKQDHHSRRENGSYPTSHGNHVDANSGMFFWQGPHGEPLSRNLHPTCFGFKRSPRRPEEIGNGSAVKSAAPAETIQQSRASNNGCNDGKQSEPTGPENKNQKDEQNESEPVKDARPAPSKYVVLDSVNEGSWVPYSASPHCPTPRTNLLQELAVIKRTA